VNAPQSKRFAKCDGVRQSRQRLECGVLSAAFWARPAHRRASSKWPRPANGRRI